VKLGESTHMPGSGAQILLTCDYYPGFMVKELSDPGMKGAEWVTVVPVQDGIAPRCRRSYEAGERFVMRGNDFMGVKDSMLFLTSPDDSTPFTVVDLETMKVLFTDSVLYRQNETGIRFAHDEDGTLSIHYRRRIEAGCSLPKDGKACWDRVKRRIGLRHTLQPPCTGYVVPGAKAWSIASNEAPPSDISDPSEIAYLITTRLVPRVSIKPALGPVRCRAEP
jgi:hypothetical protein